MKNPRLPLIQHMKAMQSEGIGCQACIGICCTMARNSMRINAAETEDIVRWIKAQPEEEQAAWLEKMKTCVDDYQLDRPTPGDGRRSLVRRSYTCPFFSPGPKGCALPRETKPLGCLAFNATMPDAANDDRCQSDQSLLSHVIAKHPDYLARSDSLKTQLGLDWDSLPIPQAIISFVNN